MVTGYLGEQIENLGFQTSHNEDFDKTNMVASLFCAMEFIESCKEDLIIAYGDIVYNPENLKSMIESNDEISLMIDKNWRDLWSLRLENPLDDAETLKIEDGNVIELLCSYDPETKSGESGAKRKVKGTLHWVSAEKAVNAEVRLYDRLFLDEDPGGHKETDFKQFLNPDSLKVITNAKLEPSLSNIDIGDKMQLQRLGYFCVDVESSSKKIVLNRTVPLRDGWAKKR